MHHNHLPAIDTESKSKSSILIPVFIVWALLFFVTSCAWIETQMSKIPVIEQTAINKAAGNIYLAILANSVINENENENGKKDALAVFTQIKDNLDKLPEGEIITVKNAFGAVIIANAELDIDKQINPLLIEICKEFFVLNIGNIYVPIGDKPQNLFDAFRQIVNIVHGKLSK